MAERKELDLIKFNQNFEEQDKLNEFYEPRITQTTQYAPQKTSIDNIILDMRASFDYLLLKLNKKENPVNDILNNDKLTIGTIYLLFFIGGLTLILSGLMKE